MKLASSFTIPAAADKVVTLFLAPTTMSSCIPGCEDLAIAGPFAYGIPVGGRKGGRR